MKLYFLPWINFLILEISFNSKKYLYILQDITNKIYLGSNLL